MPEIRIYSTQYCPYCVQAKRLMDTLKLKYSETMLDQDPALRSKLSAENGGWRTVPMIFIGTEFIGGYTDLAELHRSGNLMKRFEKV